MTGFGPARVFPSCSVQVESPLTDATPIVVSNVTLMPFEVEVTFVYDFDTALWGFRARIYTRPYLRSGAWGKKSRVLSFHEDDIDTAPPWLGDFVRLHMPPPLPPLERTPSR